MKHLGELYFIKRISKFQLAIILAGALGFLSDNVKAQSAGFELLGLNMSGAGFAPQVLPGINEKNYVFPTENYFKYWSSQGIRLIRFPIIWERLQSNLGGLLIKTISLWWIEPLLTLRSII
ncbi:hypothetical protein ACI2KR_14115 [Pseudomonas luteola]